jgi:hypothetical protein
VASAAGQREDGSPDDFYAALAARGKAARSQYNAAHTPSLTTDTHTGDLLPAAEDELRWKAEHAVRMERRLSQTVHSLLRESLLDGREHASMLDGAALGIQVLAEEGYSAHVAVRIIGSVPRRRARTSNKAPRRQPALPVTLRNALCSTLTGPATVCPQRGVVMLRWARRENARSADSPCPVRLSDCMIT